MFMKNSRNIILLAILVLLTVGYLVAGDHETMQTLKLEDLADGETRTFGEGDHKVTVTRNGDKLSLNVEGLEGIHGKHVTIGSAGHDIDCDADSGDCNVWISEDGNVITLGAGGIGGDAHANVIIEALAEGGDIEKEVHVIRIGEGGENTFTIDVNGEGAGSHIVKMIGGGHHVGHGNGMFITSGDSDKTILRCEEGDTTMTVDSEEADEIFFCPRHKTELKQVGRKVIHKKIEVRTKGDDGEGKKDTY